jgi:hypothetical protein
MPVTPFHFGVGVLGKGIAPSRFSLSSFVAFRSLAFPAAPEGGDYR